MCNLMAIQIAFRERGEIRAQLRDVDCGGVEERFQRFELRDVVTPDFESLRDG
jgi:hypothetical protein